MMESVENATLRLTGILVLALHCNQGGYSNVSEQRSTSCSEAERLFYFGQDDWHPRILSFHPPCKDYRNECTNQIKDSSSTVTTL